MKQLILFFLLAFCFVSASASHYRGSYITFERDTTQNPNPRKLFFTLTIFTDGASVADSPEVDVKMGDGNSVTVPRISITPIGNLSTMVDRETYKWEYTYASDGTYSVSHVIINRNPGILNMTPPSDQSPVYIQTTVNLNSAVGFNNSPQFLSPKPIFANIGKAVHFNFSAYDPDSDSLSFRLITPQVISSSGSIISVPGYNLPDQIFKCRNSTDTADGEFKFSESDGQLIWDAPCRQGEYIYTAVVEEWRNGIKMSEITYEMQILVFDKPGTSLDMIQIENQKYSAEGYLIVKATDKVEFQIDYNYVKPDEYIVSQAASGESNYFTSELSHVLNVPVAYDIINYYEGAKGTFSFTPDRNLIRNRPYFVNFYGYSSGKAYSRSIGIIIRDDQPIVKLQGQNKYSKTDEGYYLFLTANTVKLDMFAENLDGYTQVLSVESELAAEAEKFDFTVRDSTDGKVGELLFKPSTYQTSYTPKSITFKAIYNPSQIAEGRASAADEPIVKEMQLQVIVAQQEPTATPEELAAATYLIYPNQIQDKFTVQAEAPAELHIYSLQGKLILTQQLQPGATSVKRPYTAKAGLYFYTLTTAHGHKKTGKLVLQ